MTVLRSQFIIPYFTNLPEDVITNTMHWETDDVLDPAVDAAEVRLRLITFYNSVYTGRGANHVNFAGARIKVWDLTDPEPRVPVLNTAAALTTTPGAGQLPCEVAVVLSYHAAPVSGVNNGRLRNRIYLGGFTHAIINSGSASTFPTVANATTGAIATAADTLHAANDAGLQWVVMSKATGLAITSQISGGWVDNEPDTQRRRGVRSTLRQLWTA